MKITVPQANVIVEMTVPTQFFVDQLIITFLDVWYIVTSVLIITYLNNGKNISFILLRCKARKLGLFKIFSSFFRE